jgi:hypothetical protein
MGQTALMLTELATIICLCAPVSGPYAPAVRLTPPTTVAPDLPPARTVWDDLARCESGEQWDYNGPSGYDGGLQFAPSTWRAMDPPTAYAWQATREQQITVAERLLDVQGWGAWPGCSSKLGLR